MNRIEKNCSVTAVLSTIQHVQLLCVCSVLHWAIQSKEVYEAETCPNMLSQ